MWIEEKLKGGEFLTSTKFFNKFGFRNVVGVSVSGTKAIAGPMCVSAIILPPFHKIPNLFKINSLGKKDTEKIYSLILEKSSYLRYTFISNLDMIHRDNEELINQAIEHVLVSFSKFNPASCVFVDYPNFVKFSHFDGIPFFIESGLKNKVDCVSASSLFNRIRLRTVFNRLDKEYPEYKWSSNLGHPTKEHLAAIDTYGYTIYHRIKERK
jgi:ribonuclease HII